MAFDYTNYYRLDYLQSSGTQYINTNYSGNRNIKFECKVNKITASTNKTITIFGNMESESASVGRISLNLSTNSTNRLTRLGYGSNDNIAGTKNISLNTIHTVILSRNGLFIDGTNIPNNNGGQTLEGSDFTCGTLYLFAINGLLSQPNWFNGNTRIYYAKIWDGDTLVRDFVPVIRKSDSVLGMYDLVNNVFYTNVGSGTFTYGSILYEVNATENPSDSGTITGTGTYPSGSNVSLLATANSGYDLDYWDVSKEISSTSYVLNTSNLSVYGTANNWFQATFEKPSLITRYSGNNASDGSYSRTWDMTIKGSNDGSTWIDIQTDSMSATGTNTISVNNSTPYLYYRWYFSRYNNTYSSGRYIFENIKIYGLTEYTSTDNPLSLVANCNINAIANFKLIYQITLTYDSTLGNATYTWINGTQVQLVATPNSNAQFKGWYINSSPISTSNPYTYTPTGDVTIEARFERIYDVNDTIVGNGSFSLSRGSDKNDVTFNVIPNANNHFLSYVVDGVAYTSTPLTLHLTQDVNLTVNFEEDDKFHITATTDFPNGSIYISDNDVYSGTVVTLWARPFPDYNFVGWSDGDTANPKQITVTADVTIVASYQRQTVTNGIYQYRCYIKDQLYMTDPPKAFMRVDTFDIKTDLMTNATSTIYVLDTASNVNNGDVLVLYDPKGTTLYQGVVKSMENNKIICSQMQSFYKGTWIYNVNPQDYLEHEIAVLLQDYADGKLYQSSYTDTLVAQRLGGITIDYVGATTVNLPTDLDKDGNEELSTKDMEKWIYDLYEEYGIIFDFEINLSGANYVTIKTPTYSPIKVGNNMFAIQDMSPITKIEETNRLVIFAKDKTYRTTYVATKSGIVEEPSATTNRFDVTNTKIVFSDDDVADLIASNLPETMYNHKVTFTLIINNFIYQFGDFNLGGELEVWHGEDYYQTVLTGYQIKKQTNQNITQVGFTCGKVRTALTKLMTLGKV